MSEFKNTSVKITTFINPHLFWFYLTEDAEKIQNLVEDFQEHILNPTTIENAERGQTVLVYDKIWKRALVKDASDCRYTCWLCDYGVFYDCDKVYEIPDRFNPKPALIRQAALSGVVNVKQTLQIAGFESTHTIKFCPGTINCAKDQIADARKIFFHCLTEENGIHIGKIGILTNDGHIYDLAESLAKRGMLDLNNEFFLEAMKTNLETEDQDFLLLTRSISRCVGTRKKTKKPNTSLQEIVQDISDSKGVGRGTTRGVPLKEEVITPGKKTFVEDWLKDSTKPTSQNELNYESDDSENAAPSPNVSGNLLKTPENNSSLDASDSVSETDLPNSSFARLRRSLMKSQNKQTENITSPPLSSNRLHDKSIGSNNSTLNTSRDSHRKSSEFNPKSFLDDFSNRRETSVLNKTASSESSPGVKKDISSSEILRSLLQRPSNPESPPVANESEPDHQSDTSSPNDKYLAVLQKKFESNFKVSPDKPQDVEVSSVKSAPPQSLRNWGDNSKRAPNQKRLNIMPAGMIPAEPQKKDKSRAGSSVRSSRPGSYVSEPNRKKPVRTASSGHPSKASSSASSATSLSKLNEYGRGLPHSNANGKSAIEFLRQNCTQGCTCHQCKEWGVDEVCADYKEFADTEPKKQKVPVKPHLLLKTNPDENEVLELQSQASVIADVTKTGRAVAPKIVIHGRMLPTPLTSITAVPFHAHIHRTLQSFQQAFTIQSYVWPCIMRKHNVCMVSAPKSGKTMAYLPPLCSFLLDKKERYEELPGNTMSPIAIILCPGSRVANNVQDLMLKLIKCPGDRNRPTYAFAVPPLDKNCLNQFQKQCDILIATPVALVTLLRARLITVKRLCQLVIESGDKILEKFSKETDNVLNLVQSMLEHRTCILSTQLIVTAEHWTLQLENLMKRVNITPVVCVASYLEAALYGRVDIQMHFLKSQNKRHNLTELLKDKAAICKTVVICNNDSEINEAKEYLDSSGVNTVYMYDGMDKQEIIDLETKWNCSIGGKNLALVCTDQVFNSCLNISDAILLVHYSLPDTWTQFASRFSCLLDNYTSPLATKLPSDWVRCIVHIYVDEACAKQFPKLVQLLQRMGVKLSTKFVEYYMQTIKAREEEKLASKIKLCPNLKLFGRCLSDNRQLYQPSPDSEVSYSSLNCKKRHILSAETDYSSNLPKCGVIKFKIIHVQDVTTYTVRILEHTDPDGNTRKWESRENLQAELDAAMAERKICVFDVKLGGWYVWCSEEDGTYRRCVVQKILQLANITKTASYVNIRYLDSGVEEDVHSSTLYELPKKLRNVPAQGVHVTLANTIPPDFDESWSASSKAKVEHMLNEAGYRDEHIYGIGQILLQLGNVIWVKNVLLREKLATVDTIVTQLNLRKSLKEQDLVVYSEEQLAGLYDLCKSTGIELPDFSKLPEAAGKELENKSKQQAQPQWAYFDDCDCNEIYISCVFTPALFYVRLKKFYALFESLQKEIQEAITKPFYIKDLEIEVGKYYLAKDFGGEDYCRVKVTEIRENIADCFYVDFGDNATVNVADIKHLADQLIVKLPFQAIECRLYGVQPAWGGDDWEETAANIVHDYIFEPDTDYYRTLYTTTCKQEPATGTGGQKAAVLLIDSFKENRIILINQLLIDCGEAVNIEGEDLDKEFHVPEVHEEPDDVPDVDDVEDKDLTIEDIERLASKYKTDDKINNNKKTSEISSDNEAGINKCNSLESNDSEPSWDIVIDDPETFMKLLIGAKVNDRQAISGEPELPPMRALEASSHHTPNVVWFQTDDLISINIMLPDLKEYTLRVTRNKMLMFKAMYEGKQYCLELQLYDKVAKTFEYKVYGQYVKVLLTKCTPIEWPRLIFSSDRMRHIKYDVSRIVVAEEEKKTFLKFTGGEEEINGTDCLIDIGSDEDYSESDVESYSSN